MGFFKNRFCMKCGIEYEPRSSNQKYCLICSKENRKKLVKEAFKRFIEKRKKQG